MTQVVIGLGIVGAAVRDGLGADGWDLRDQDTRPIPSDAAVLHIAFPWSPAFVSEVRRYQARQRVDALTIIHSTVPIGTTAEIPGAVHSPVWGREPTMAEDVRRMPRWIGGRRAAEAQPILTALTTGPVTCLPSSDQTEALKLLCLAQYGTALAFDRYARDVLAAVGLGPETKAAWDHAYNAHTESHLRRPIPTPEPGPIGGHCVIPGTRLLAGAHPHPLLDGVLRYGAGSVQGKIHPLAVVYEPGGLGPDTVVWQFCTIMPGVRTGAHCSFGSGTHVGRNTVIGESVRVGDKVHITDHMTIGDRVFIAPLAVMANDKHPVVNNPHYRRESPVIEDDVSIGVGAVILPGVRLGRGCQIGAGAVVTKDVAPGAVVVGNPARPLERRIPWDGGMTLRDVDAESWSIGGDGAHQGDETP